MRDQKTWSVRFISVLGAASNRPRAGSRHRCRPVNRRRQRLPRPRSVTRHQQRHGVRA